MAAPVRAADDKLRPVKDDPVLFGSFCVFTEAFGGWLEAASLAAICGSPLCRATLVDLRSTAASASAHVQSSNGRAPSGVFLTGAATEEGQGPAKRIVRKRLEKSASLC